MTHEKTKEIITDIDKEIAYIQSKNIMYTKLADRSEEEGNKEAQIGYTQIAKYYLAYANGLIRAKEILKKRAS